MYAGDGTETGGCCDHTGDGTETGDRRDTMWEAVQRQVAGVPARGGVVCIAAKGRLHTLRGTGPSERHKAFKGNFEPIRGEGFTFKLFPLGEALGGRRGWFSGNLAPVCHSFISH